MLRGGRLAAATTGTPIVGKTGLVAYPHRWLVAGVVAALCLPVVVVLVALVSTPWFASGDHGLIWLRTSDVGTGATPLVGPYSRAGWNHPGPLLFYLLAVPLRLAGGDPRGLLVGAALINVASLVGVGWLLARRRDPLVTLVVGASLAVLLAAMGASLLTDPWNPYVAVLPFVFVLLCGWAASGGDRWALVAFVAAASFVVQSHAGYAIPVSAVGMFAVVGWLRGVGALRLTVVPLAVAGLVALAVWAPPLADQVSGTGNFGELVRGGGGSSAPSERLGVQEAVGIAALELGPRGPWSSGPESVELFTGDVEPAAAAWLVVPGLALAGAVLVFRRRRQAAMLRLAALVASAGVGGVVATALVSGTVHPYVIRWWWPIAALWWAVVVLGACELVRPWLVAHRPRVAAGALATLGIAAAVVVGATVVRAPGAPPPAAAYQHAEAAITQEAVAAVDPDVAVETRRAGASWGGEAFGLLVSLERAGMQVAVPHDRAWQFGDRRAQRQPGQALLVASGREAIDAGELASERDGVVVATWDPLDAEEREEANELWERLAEGFERHGATEDAAAARAHAHRAILLGGSGMEVEELQRLGELVGAGTPVAVVHVPPVHYDPQR